MVLSQYHWLSGPISHIYDLGQVAMVHNHSYFVITCAKSSTGLYIDHFVVVIRFGTLYGHIMITLINTKQLNFKHFQAHCKLSWRQNYIVRRTAQYYRVLNLLKLLLLRTLIQLEIICVNNVCMMTKLWSKLFMMTPKQSGAAHIQINIVQ
jgi:hypothetical protein